jgi:hypothetical protein
MDPDKIQKKIKIKSTPNQETITQPQETLTIVPEEKLTEYQKPTRQKKSKKQNEQKEETKKYCPVIKEDQGCEQLSSEEDPTNNFY